MILAKLWRKGRLLCKYFYWKAYVLWCSKNIRLNLDRKFDSTFSLCRKWNSRAGTILDKYEIFQKLGDGYLGFYFTELVTLLWALSWYHRCQMFCPLFCGHPPLSSGTGLQAFPLFRVGFFFFHNLIDSTCCYSSAAFWEHFPTEKNNNTQTQ